MNNYKDIDLESLQTHKVEVTSGIYFLYHDNEMVYIGMSVNIPRRIREHSSEKVRWFNSYKQLFIESDHSDLREIEKNYIIKYKPRFNIIHNNGDIETYEDTLQVEEDHDVFGGFTILDRKVTNNG